MLFDEWVGERFLAPVYQQQFYDYLMGREEHVNLPGNTLDRHWQRFEKALPQGERQQIRQDFEAGIRGVFLAMIEVGPNVQLLGVKGMVFVLWDRVNVGSAIISWN